ncbi:MAG: lytic transglycosylase domain-containing protein [Oligoflexales bacterium]
MTIKSLILQALLLLGLVPAVRADNFGAEGDLAKQVWFWTQVFDRYPANTFIIHDATRPFIIIDIVDFGVLGRKIRGAAKFNRIQRESVANNYLKRYELAVDRVRTEGKRAARHGAMEKRILYVYQRNPYDFQHLMKERPELRLQVGMATEFDNAAERSASMIPYMESIFSKQQMPVELTRLAFVESMFNVDAVSKVGASGLWQIMPSTGREFLIINHYIDERNSPYKATRAAASLLKQNFKTLKTWPLAVTAYNHGAGGIARAVKRLGTRDLNKIIKYYRSNSFGFASRNFYSEFLAARNVYNKKYRMKNPSKSVPQLTEIAVSKISLDQVIRNTPLSERIIRDYNRCLKPEAFDRFRHTPLPKDYKLVVPHYMVGQLNLSFKDDTKSRRAAWTR